MKKGDKIKIVKSAYGCCLDDGETVTLLCKSTLDSSDWMVERSNGGEAHLFFEDGTVFEKVEKKYMIKPMALGICSDGVSPSKGGVEIDVIYKDEDLCVFRQSVRGGTACCRTKDLIEIPESKTITIDGKDIEISEESYEAFKKQFTEEG